MSQASDKQTEIAKVVAAIGTYSRAHPHAADSTEGIMNWWLKDNFCDEEIVCRSLDELVAQGTLTRKTNPDGTVIYSCKG